MNLKVYCLLVPILCKNLSFSVVTSILEPVSFYPENDQFYIFFSSLAQCDSQAVVKQLVLFKNDRNGIGEQTLKVPNDLISKKIVF